MLLTNKWTDKQYQKMQEYYCELTEFLDEEAGFAKGGRYKHYILADDVLKKDKCIAIRVPGGTVGGVTFNDDMIITHVAIDKDYVVKSYPDNILDLISQFVGQKIEFSEEEGNNDK